MVLSSTRVASERRSSLGRSQQLPLRTKIDDLIESSSSEQGFAEAFVQEIWSNVEADYKALAEEIVAVCKQQLDDRHIPAFAEHRVKSRSSISKSLERRELHRMMEGKGPYENFSSILEDLHDLAGIRLVVDYPRDLEATSSLVTESFHPQKEPNVFGSNREVGRSWKVWFGAYECTNHHVTAAYEQDNPLHIYNDVIFEIQVTSLPASLYNKIAHPLLYKDEVGPLSRGDEIVIDLTKGLALCYSLCLYYKAEKLEDGQINVMRQASSGGSLDTSVDTLIGMMPSIPGLDSASIQAKPIPRKKFQLALEDLPLQSENRTTTAAWESLLGLLNREIREIPQPPINLPTVGRARFDSDDVNASPRCLEGTRENVRRYIHDWVNEDQDQTILLWIHGPAGTGKSTLARTLANEFAETGQIAAGYFFKRGDMERNHESRIFPTLSSQLASTIPHFESSLRRSLKESQNTDIQSMRLDHQFVLLLESPLSEMDLLSSTKLIIIDALDECCNLDRSAEIIGLLDRLRDLKTLRIRILVTSRDELPLRKAMNQVPHRSLSLATDFCEEAASDIEEVLKHGFTKIRIDTKIEEAWPTNDQFQEILKRATDPSPLFIYASTLLRFVHDDKPQSHPKRRLDSWLNRQDESSSTTQVDEMYTTVLENLDRDLQDGRPECLTSLEKRELQTILGSLVLAEEPLSAEALANILDMETDTVSYWLRSCRAVIERPVDDSSPVKVAHKSFNDFILETESSKTGWLTSDERDLHKYLAERCIECLREGLHQNICQLQGPGTLQMDIEPTTINRVICQDLQYASSYWSHHLLRGQFSSLQAHYLESFLNDHFLQWTECMAILGRLPHVSKAINSLYVAIKKQYTPSFQTLLPLLKDIRRFLLSHWDIIRERPLQAYGTALIFSPTYSLIQNLFWDSRLPGIKDFRGAVDPWNPCLKELPFRNTGEIDSLAISPDGETIAFSCWALEGSEFSQHMELWHVGRGARVDKFTIDDRAFALTWTQDELSLISISPEGKVLAYDLLPKTASTCYSLQPRSNTLLGVAFSIADIHPCGIATLNGNEVSVDPYSLTDILYIWNYQTGEAFQPLRFTQERVRSLCISPDGSQIAMALTDWHRNIGRGSVRLVDIVSGSCIHNFGHHECMSQNLAYSPDGKQLLIQSGFDINVHSLQTGDVESTREYASPYGDIVAFLPGGESIISRYPDSFKIWDMEELRNATVLQGPAAEVETIESLVDLKRVVISPNGRFLVSDDGARLRLWNLSDDKYEGQLAIHLHILDDLKILSFTADSESLSLCAKNMFYKWMMGKIRNAELSSRDPECKIKAQLVICSDGLNLRRVSGSDLVGIRPELSSSHISASWANGRTVAVYNLRTLEVWKLGPAPKLHHILRLGHATKPHFALTIPGEQQIMAVALSANDEYLAVAYGTTLKVWALKDSFRASEPKTIEHVVAMALSPDGSILALASFSTIWIWTTTSHDGLKCLFQHEISRSSIHLPLEQSPTQLPVLGFASTSNTLVAARSFPNSSVILWDESSGLKFIETKPGNGGYSDISFSQDETHVYLTGGALIDCYRIKSASELGSDKEIRISFDEEGWIHPNGQKFLKIMPENLSHVSYGGNRLAVVDAGKVLLFHFE
ncbi:hypothetical protein H9Q74_006016 [Fusarium xylarioides]|nr:hypothetical protein H9Q74_006016 [Fusarium xylarioides]